MRPLPSRHRGEERALSALLAAGGNGRLRRQPDHRAGLRPDGILAAVADGYDPAGPYPSRRHDSVGRTHLAAPPAGRDPAGAVRARRVTAVRQASLGGIEHHQRGAAADQAHRRGTGRDPRLERPDRRRDQPGTGGRTRRASDRGSDRLVPVNAGVAFPGPQRHPAPPKSSAWQDY